GELEHRHVKRFYARTNKVAYSLQIARKQRRRALLQAIRARDTFKPPSEERHVRKDVQRAYAEARERMRKPLHPNFIPLLIDHLLRRFTEPLGTLDDQVDFSFAQQQAVQILDDRLYPHKALQLNYTTYDVRRDQDYVNPRTHPDIMVLADEDSDDDHPFWYARVIGIFHANVRYTGPGSTRTSSRWQRVDLVWVRWFERDQSHPCGFAHRRLPRLQFVDANDPDGIPFSFLDPADIVRAAYVMPAPAHGQTDGLLNPSPLARRCKWDGIDDDYYYYYASMCVSACMYLILGES
ncbi:hypothetical protein C8T65DRAFT_579653, partial [Cerioporus squamosus]